MLFELLEGGGAPPPIVRRLEPGVLSEAQDELINQGCLEEAERLLTEAIDARACDLHVARLERARIAFWRGRLRFARFELERLHKERPHDGWVSSFFGQVEARFGNVERARELFREALAVDPSNHEARLFTSGDTLGDTLRAQRMRTHGEVSPRARIELATLYAAIDFRRDVRVSLARGDLTQAWLDRANLMIDHAEPGQDVEVEVSLREAFLRADRVILYSSQALGDAVLGLSALDALAAFFAMRPASSRPVLELITPYAAVIEGITRRHPGVVVRSLCGPRDTDEAAIYAAELTRRTERVACIVASSRDVVDRLEEVARVRSNVTAVIDVHIDRHARDLVPWQTVTGPRRMIDSYPARLHRLLEIALGVKLSERPADIEVILPLAPELEARRRSLLERHGLEHAALHCVVESASKRSKAFAPALLRDFCCALANACEERERATGIPQRIVFSRDAQLESSLAGELSSLPEPARSSIVPIYEDLASMTALFSGADSIISTDTGLAHVASALGRPTVIVYAVADARLWRTGGRNVRALSSPYAEAARTNLTPVNMQEWEAPYPLMAEAISVRDLLDAWRRCVEDGDRSTESRPPVLRTAQGW